MESALGNALSLKNGWFFEQCDHSLQCSFVVVEDFNMKAFLILEQWVGQALQTQKPPVLTGLTNTKHSDFTDLLGVPPNSEIKFDFLASTV